MDQAITPTSTHPAAWDFFADARAALWERLSGMGYELPDAADLHVLCRAYLNVRRRQIAPRPRRVHWSSELTLRPLPAPRSFVLAEIARKAAAGENLNPFLHKPLRDKPAFNDLLLNDWGLHHLHLGSSEPRPGEHFTDRSGELLFARVEPEDIYLVDVLDHHAFAEEELVRTMHRNWPSVLEGHRLHGVSAYRGPSRAVARMKRFMVPIMLEDGGVFASLGGGYSTSGLSLDVLVATDRLHYRLRELEARCSERADWIRSVVAKQTGRRPDTLDLRLRLDGDEVMVEVMGHGVGIYPGIVL